MSNYQTKDNTGVVFKNDRKEKETHPDYTGTALVDGVEYFMDGWLNAADSGRKYQKFSFKRKDKQPSSAPAPAPKNRQSYDEDRDPIPF